jgi:hypothetical protein
MVDEQVLVSVVRRDEARASADGPSLPLPGRESTACSGGAASAAVGSFARAAWSVLSPWPM